MFVSAPVSDVRIRPDNAPRFVAGSGADHYESWFLRANDPGSPRAVWLKATILQPRGGEAIAESWCALFGMGGDTPWAAKATVPRADATFAGEPLAATIGASTFNFDTSGASAGELVAHEQLWKELKEMTELDDLDVGNLGFTGLSKSMFLNVKITNIKHKVSGYFIFPKVLHT